jgi:hypothetical protein
MGGGEKMHDIGGNSNRLTDNKKEKSDAEVEPEARKLLTSTHVSCSMLCSSGFFRN